MAAGPKTPEELAAIFDAADADKDGFLSPKELADLIRSKNDKISDFQIAHIFVRLGGATTKQEVFKIISDPSQKIDKEKFIEGVGKIQTALGRLRDMLEKLGTEGLDKKDICGILKKVFMLESEEEAEGFAEDVMGRLDKNNDGKVSVEELQAAMAARLS